MSALGCGTEKRQVSLFGHGHVVSHQLFLQAGQVLELQSLPGTPQCHTLCSARYRSATIPGPGFVPRM